MLIYTSSVLIAGALITLHQKIDLIPDFGGKYRYLELKVKNLNSVFSMTFTKDNQENTKIVSFPLDAFYLLSFIFCSNSKRLKFINSSVI